MTMTYEASDGVWQTTATYAGFSPVPVPCEPEASHDWIVQADAVELPEEVEEMPGAKYMQIMVCKKCRWSCCRITVEKP